ncbi:twin arginine translocase protein A [Lacunisphaera limnophila]|uniref:Sec-independent protein translocase protein TatA n=1 Tax=Lacunisphaera limnophila TaxID=1838286 RepID=A0A1D8AVX9_9BACT|nr:twin-arginine translocase TatA/TatE family subunit [Lacunisphaera limnophila]AOS45050.1 twin arginine translocase protein A [Lacunisphaera limnophila]
MTGFPTLPPAFIEGIGGPELLMIMFVILLLFGANRMPDLARGFGRAVREFKKATSGVEQEVRRAMEEPPPSPKPRPLGTIGQGETPPPAPPPAQTPPPPAAG